MKNKRVILLARRIFLPATALFAHGPAVRAMGILGLALLLGPAARAQTILGSTGDYAVMAGSTVTINGTTTNTHITGNLAAAGAIAGSQATTYLLNGVTGPATPGAMSGQNQTDFTRAFTGLAAMTPTANLTGMTLGTTAGAIVLTPGVYKFDATAQLTGTLTLDAQSQSNAVWVFQIGTTLGTADLSHVTFANTLGDSVANYGVFWQITNATTIGAGSTLEGNFLGGGAFSFGSGATILDGRALTGAAGTITLSDNTINFIGSNSGYSGGLAFVDSGTTITAVPEPATTSVLIAGFLGLVVGVRRIRRNRSDRKLDSGI